MSYFYEPTEQFWRDLEEIELRLAERQAAALKEAEKYQRGYLDLDTLDWVEGHPRHEKLYGCAEAIRECRHDIQRLIRRWMELAAEENAPAQEANA